MTAIVVDTSAILAIFDEAYAEHQPIADLLVAEPGPLVVSPMIAAEADYMLQARVGTAAARLFAADVGARAYELAEWTADDHGAALSVSDRYGGRDYLGLADASNIVLADRCRTNRLLTLDQRHFRQLRPLWGADHFVLLPYDA